MSRKNLRMLLLLPVSVLAVCFVGKPHCDWRMPSWWQESTQMKCPWERIWIPTSFRQQESCSATESLFLWLLLEADWKRTSLSGKSNVQIKLQNNGNFGETWDWNEKWHLHANKCTMCKKQLADHRIHTQNKKWAALTRVTSNCC